MKNNTGQIKTKYITFILKSYDEYTSVCGTILSTHLQKRIVGAIWKGRQHNPRDIQMHLKKLGYKPEYSIKQISNALQKMKKKQIVEFKEGNWNIFFPF